MEALHGIRGNATGKAELACRSGHQGETALVKPVARAGKARYSN
ncbi:MAG: hypothetical protein ABIJ39_13125 [Chloroflexota bacterium]